jgi:hypothetical protein
MANFVTPKWVKHTTLGFKSPETFSLNGSVRWPFQPLNFPPLFYIWESILSGSCSSSFMYLKHYWGWLPHHCWTLQEEYGDPYHLQQSTLIPLPTSPFDVVQRTVLDSVAPSSESPSSKPKPCFFPLTTVSPPHAYNDGQLHVGKPFYIS